MESCGRCGVELGRELERGRFCARCGHENPGNARYPLWDTGAGGRAPTIVEAGGAASATAVALPRVTDRPAFDDATRVRMPSISMMATAAPAGAEQAEPVSAWRTTLLASLGATAVVLLLGFFLLFH